VTCRFGLASFFLFNPLIFFSLSFDALMCVVSAVMAGHTLFHGGRSGADQRRGRGLHDGGGLQEGERRWRASKRRRPAGRWRASRRQRALPKACARCSSRSARRARLWRARSLDPVEGFSGYPAMAELAAV
jgi:hypothetical protein